MRKEIQHNTRSDAEFFAPQKSIGVFVETFPVHHDDQFIDAPAFEGRPDFLTAEDPDELQPPNVVTLNRSRELMSGRAVPHNSNMPDLENAALGYFHQNDSIRNKKYVIDDQREQNDDAVGGIRIDEGDQNGNQQPRKTYRLRKTADLSQWRQRRLGINTKERQQESPYWKDDCKKPQIHLNGHHRVPLHLKQQTEAVCQKETCRRQSEIGQPQVYGKNSFSLINHAGRDDECPLQT